jgi:hypothetical protein
VIAASILSRPEAKLKGLANRMPFAFNLRQKFHPIASHSGLGHLGPDAITLRRLERLSSCSKPLLQIVLLDEK